MKKEREYRERCAKAGLDGAATDAAVDAARAMEADAKADGDSLSVAGFDEHVAALEKAGLADEGRLRALARYCSLVGNDAVAIRALAYLLPIGVLEGHLDRLEKLEGRAVRDRVIAKLTLPAPCSPPERYVEPTAALVRALEAELGPARASRVLMWNVHGIPASAYENEKKLFDSAPSIQAWLSGFHERQVATLARHAADGTLWFEQRITPRVVDFVRGNPEMLGGVVDGDKIMVTKIPYDPDGFIGAVDQLERRRLACHCPHARSSITESGAAVPTAWCACSAGFEKFMFDVVFGEEVETEVLESVLAGDPRCRFANTIPKSVLARKTSV